ncbi:hypothetical protein [Bradyrhizobium sp. AZCC 2230]|uniref:hypothetical protein n=1 Tax=Bradyrhizobium sp. AZCC 2230 TaxID=3117021 RepID=UPI002FF0FC7A
MAGFTYVALLAAAAAAVGTPGSDPAHTLPTSLVHEGLFHRMAYSIADAFAQVNSPLSLLVAVMLSVTVVASLPIWISIVAASLVLLLQAATTRMFGWTDFFAGFFVELAIEPLPFEAHVLTHINWSEQAGLKGVVHSWT